MAETVVGEAESPFAAFHPSYQKLGLVCGSENGQFLADFEPPGSSESTEDREAMKGVLGLKKRYTRAEMEALRFSVGVKEQRLCWDKAYEGLGLVCGSENGQNLADFEPTGILESTEDRKSMKGVLGLKKRYTRAEMEALRFALGDREQRLWWDKVYEGLGEVVGREYDGLCAETGVNASKNRKRRGRKKDDLYIKGEVPSVNNCRSLEILDLPQDSEESNVNGQDSQAVEDVYYENGSANDVDYGSDDDCASIQRPAFLVEGDPDFDAGPPQDGLEYLRRVRWEAAQIPKVKVVRVQSGEQIKEQTPYMPKIPEIPKIPSSLLPSNHWEKAFLADFSDLRQAFCQLESSCEQPSVTLNKDSSKHTDAVTDTARPLPTLSIIRRMDFVSRAATLRNYTRMFEGATVLSRDDCLWLFALCAVVDTPLDADTCASLRCLLRKCSDLLAMKSEPDDDVAMLNILITITGKFFGQSENK